MAKRFRKIDIDKLIKEGRGTGVGIEYKPWIKIQDVPSLGRSTRLKGIKTGRQHEFLSDMEKNYFYIVEYSECARDIREQYPLLPIEETLTIAKELGIEHPKNPKNGEYIVMTTDFFITKETEGKIANIARTIKAKDMLMNKRVIEKFEIERVYWERKGVEWSIVTEEEINKTIAENISFFHSYYNIEDIDTFVTIDKTELEDLVLEYIKRTIDTDNSVRKVSSIFDKDMNLSKGTGIAIFKHLLARKIILTDLSKSIDIDTKMDIDLSENILHKEFNIS
ncbi:heteromeric transposase endonuclease subunit TnsA [Clostridium akagii]|uniref:heteromeric transposase endonuclease subunit TnsA n=1 Tax=Clostridium akagii TaxID=91623 RepID=UPI00047ACF9B|nr:heteromeric transposase endonuclease subunit TnsA [Clostridium akagii]